jgi:beta-phosphoglucomutase-like phosphatase (HAD superfamily)
MNSIQKPEMIFIDFDGVISKNSVLLNIKSAHQFISQYTPIPYEALFSFFKSTTCFSLQHTTSFILSSLGIEDKLSEFYQEQLIKKLYDNTQIKIEDDFYQFLDFCDCNSIRYLVYSSTDKGVKRLSELINRIGNNICNLNGQSKANYGTYSNVAKELKIDLKKCMYIDDTPLALLTGKLHGMTTVMMLNDVFTLEDYQIFSLYIDYKINSFTELLEFF